MGVAVSTFDQRAYQRAYHARRRALSKELGLCQRCNKPAAVRDGKTLSRCAMCLPKINAKRTQERHYIPLDAILERPKVQLLRMLTRFDLASTSDLLIALGIDHNRGVYTSDIAELRACGLITQADSRFGRYAITPAGRAWLAKQLARADVGVASDDELEEEAA